MRESRLETLSGVELVALAAGEHSIFKDVSAELSRRDADVHAADALIHAYREGQMPAWLVAHLLGCVRAPQGYDVAREILLAAPRLLAESYAGAAMARIARDDAYDDLVRLMMEAQAGQSRRSGWWARSASASRDGGDLFPSCAAPTHSFDDRATSHWLIAQHTHAYCRMASQ